MELILSDHDRKCLSCVRSGSCELQKLCYDLKVENETAYEGERNEYELDGSSAHMVRDNNKCILVVVALQYFEHVQGHRRNRRQRRGFKTNISCAFEMDLAETSCVSCGQCIAVCPTGALYEQDHVDELFAALNDPISM